MRCLPPLHHGWPSKSTGFRVPTPKVRTQVTFDSPKLSCQQRAVGRKEASLITNCRLGHVLCVICSLCCILTKSKPEKLIKIVFIGKNARVWTCAIQTCVQGSAALWPPGRRFSQTGDPGRMQSVRSHSRPQCRLRSYLPSRGQGRRGRAGSGGPGSFLQEVTGQSAGPQVAEGFLVFSWLGSSQALPVEIARDQGSWENTYT